MITNKKWDTLISVLIWIFIMAIIILWLINILSYNYVIEDNYIKDNKLLILQNNTENIIRNLNMNSLSEWDVFYIYKNPLTYNFEIYTWSTSTNFKYINEHWDFISNTWAYDWIIYERTLYVQKNDTTLWLQNQVIKTEIKEFVGK
jgi:hypothetical protein